MRMSQIVGLRALAASTVSLVLLAVPCRAVEFETERLRIRVVTVATGLQHPWSLAFLPDGRMLVTERPGRLRFVNRSGQMSAPLGGVPAVDASGQGGLLDVALAPDFAESHTLFLSFAEKRADGNGTSVIRARLDDMQLTDTRVIFRQLPSASGHGHFGSRLVFGRDGLLFVTLGERQLKHYTVRAQDLETHFGKIVRITSMGEAPPDNPLIAVPGSRPEIWSYGHRNVQGAALHPATGELWISEHGPKGGDEINVARPGANFGWPLVTHGKAYSGDTLGVGATRAGIASPVHQWTPSIATSGLTFYDADVLAPWRGNLFAGGLAGTTLVRLELSGSRVTHEERLLTDLEHRIRDVRCGPDGLLYMLTDSPQGQLLRIEPAARR